MSRRHVLMGVLAAGLAGCGAYRPAEVRPFAFPDPDLVMLITGGTHARLELCDCPGTTTGGLSSRSGLAFSYRAACPNVFLLDAGDVLWIEPTDLRNRYVLRGYRTIGYDAVVLGDQEWAAAGAGLGEFLRAAPMDYLATNARHGRAKLPVTAEVLRDYRGWKLAVLSYLGRGSLRFAPPEGVRHLAIDPLAAVARRAGELKKRGYVVVLAAHSDEAELAAGGPLPVDLIVRGHCSRPGKEVGRVGSVPLVKVGGGDFVGVVALKVRKGRIAAIDYRVETLDEHWPVDRRLGELTEEYTREADRLARAAKRAARRAGR